MIIIISCGRRKLARPAPAGELYTGTYARGGLRWARTVVPTDHIYVLSALYGLVPHDRVIAPYEKTLSDPGAVTAAQVREQALALGISDAQEVLVVGGRPYVALARAVWPHARAPFSGKDLRVGRQVGALAAARGRVP